MAILAIDAGTTGVTALVIDGDGRTFARAYTEFEQHYPQPGWVEHDPEQIWQAVLTVVRGVLAETPTAPTCIGITNQRETVVLWDKQTLRSPLNAIVWQDRRTAELLNDSKFRDAAERVQSLTGLPLDPYFSSSKLLWIKRNHPEIWRGVEAGSIAVGTIESYLVARMTGAREHITDASNASRTQLFNLKTGDWDDSLLELFEVPRVALPRVVPNYGKLAKTYPPAFLGLEIEITGMAGDQQAALFGQGCVEVGDAKCTYGTGAFMLMNTGDKIAESKNRLLATVAWQHPDGRLEYALEGSVFVAGAAVQWLRDGLGIISSASEVEELAASVPDSAGVTFVPALTGLGAPFWLADVRGSLQGITRGTTKAHLARATLEGIAYQVYWVFKAMSADAGVAASRIRVDGGAAANNLLMQIQADQLQCRIERPANLESTALGAAFFAGLGAGIWASADELAGLNPVRSTFTPGAFNQIGADAWREALTRLDD